MDNPDNQVLDIQPGGGTAYWQDRGWTFGKSHGKPAYSGFYQIRDTKNGQLRQFPGRIIIFKRGPIPSPEGERMWDEYQTFVKDLPSEMAKHPKFGCLKSVGNGWFQLHWERGPDHPDVAILYVEKILGEAINTQITTDVEVPKPGYKTKGEPS